jgi:hypothetical protein
MKTTPKHLPLAAALVCTVTFTNAIAQQVPPPKTAADLPGPAAGTLMTREYVQTVGRMAYIWGWPLVNLGNRIVAFSKFTQPVLVGGVVPANFNGAEGRGTGRLPTEGYAG